jgi:hypothetical protein
MRLLAAALVAACLVTPAFAQDCITSDALVAKLKADGDTIAGTVAIPGAHLDHIIIDLDANGSWLWAIKGGCVVGRPIGIGDPAPDSAPQSKPTVHGSGMEIGT